MNECEAHCHQLHHSSKTHAARCVKTDSMVTRLQTRTRPQPSHLCSWRSAVRPPILSGSSLTCVLLRSRSVNLL